MGKYIRHHKYELSILGMPWKKVSVIKDKDMGQRGEAMDYEGELSGKEIEVTDLPQQFCI